MNMFIKFIKKLFFFEKHIHHVAIKEFLLNNEKIEILNTTTNEWEIDKNPKFDKNKQYRVAPIRRI